MGKGSAPEPPDPYETADAQTQSALTTAIANNAMSATQTNTPFGSVNTTQTGTQTITGADGKEYVVPTYTQDVNVSDDVRATIDARNRAQRTLGDATTQAAGVVSDIIGTPVSDYAQDRQRVEDALMARLQPQIEQDREAMRTRMANQGIGIGSDAYSDANMDLERGISDARLGAILSAGQEQSRLVNQDLAVRNQPFQELAMLQGGSRPQVPQPSNFQASRLPTVDIAGMINQNYQSELENYRMQQAQTQSLLGNLFGAAGTLGAAFISDRRMKRDIRKVGQNGPLGVYEFRYTWSDKFHRGYMADEVEAVKPEAVTQLGAIKAVDYAQLPEVV